MNDYGLDSDAVIRLVAAVLLGAVVGAEREIDDEPAGLRTHIAVCFGSALFGVVSSLGFLEFQDVRSQTNIQIDVTRVASQVVVGLGFLGAGLIIRRDSEVFNLTTAASVWAVAAIGLAAGVGDIGLAAVGALTTVLYLFALRPLRTWMRRHLAREAKRLRVTLASGFTAEAALDELRQTLGVELRATAVEKDETGRAVLLLDARANRGADLLDPLVRLAAHPGVDRVCQR